MTNGFVEVGLVNANFGYTSSPPQWRSIFACKACGALVLGNAGHDDSWLVLHAKWHQNLASEVSEELHADSAGYIHARGGGRGGNAYVSGSNSVAIGGKGGAG